ncbi:MAG: PAS domain S-box protein [Candidatus Sulfotelmatobacter sp.]
MRVLVVDDHEVVRRGVRSLISTDPRYEICGEAADGQDAIEKSRQLTPDLIVMDISMPRLNGLEAAPLIRAVSPHSEILILSQHDSPEMVRQAVKAGARGYVVKSSIARDLMSALESVSRHQPFFDSAVSAPAGIAPIDPKEIFQRSAALELALRDNEELYRSTFEAADLGIAQQNPDGQWLHVNQKLCEIVGYTQEELRKLKFQDITHPDDLGAELEQLEKMCAGLADTYSHDKRYIRKDGAAIWVSLRVSAIRDRDRQIKRFIVVVEEAASRREAEQAKYRLAAIVESSDDAIVSKNLNGIIQSWNSGAERIFGYTAAEVIGQPITIIIPPELRDEEKQIIARLRKGQRIDHFETVRVTKSGRRLNVSLTVSPVIDSSGHVIGASKVARDITEQKEERDKLEARVQQRTQELEEKNKALLRQTETVRELSIRLLRTQDDERRRIARDLHDSAGQILVALQMHLAPLQAEAHKLDPESRNGVAESLNLVDQLSRELRTLSYLLHPPLLDEAGLPSALAWYVEGFSQRSKIEVQLDVSPELGRLPGDLEMTIFRIVQESLTNIHRHSGSDRARIALLRDAGEICLQIQDNGCGMPISQNGGSPRLRTGVGIQGMHERVKQLGGRFEVSSNGKGTQVTAAFPLASDADPEEQPVSSVDSSN